MTHNILIIEDDTDINNMTADALKKEGYGCTQAFSGTEGLLYIEKEPYSLVILDLMLPGMNGEELLPQIKEKQAVPVIVVSAKDSLDSKVELLTSGAEDYMTKPFEIQELIARIGVQIRRFADTQGGKPEVLTYKDLQLRPDSFTATVHGKSIDLTRQEFKILGYELELEPLDFGACVYSTLFSFYEDFQKKGIEPHTDFCDGHLMISGNEEAIRRALQNLIKNALEHGGTQISFLLFRKNGFAGFRCSNQVTNGGEIDIGQVFQRFYKADSARTHTSAGLGLAIARGLVEKMGGTATAELKDDIFSVTLQFPCLDFPPRNAL